MSESFPEILSAYLDGELSPEEKLRFEQELNQNPALKAEMESMQAIQMQLRNLPAIDPEFNFLEKLQEVAAVGSVLPCVTPLPVHSSGNSIAIHGKSILADSATSRISGRKWVYVPYIATTCAVCMIATWSLFTLQHEKVNQAANEALLTQNDVDHSIHKAESEELGKSNGFATHREMKNFKIQAIPAGDNLAVQNTAKPETHDELVREGIEIKEPKYLVSMIDDNSVSLSNRYQSESNQTSASSGEFFYSHQNTATSNNLNTFQNKSADKQQSNLRDNKAIEQRVYKQTYRNRSVVMSNDADSYQYILNDEAAAKNENAVTSNFAEDTHQKSVVDLEKIDKSASKNDSGKSAMPPPSSKSKDQRKDDRNSEIPILAFNNLVNQSQTHQIVVIRVEVDDKLEINQVQQLLSHNKIVPAPQREVQNAVSATQNMPKSAMSPLNKQDDQMTDGPKSNMNNGNPKIDDGVTAEKIDAKDKNKADVQLKEPDKVSSSKPAAAQPDADAKSDNKMDTKPSMGLNGGKNNIANAQKGKNPPLSAFAPQSAIVEGKTTPGTNSDSQANSRKSQFQMTQGVYVNASVVQVEKTFHDLIADKNVKGIEVSLGEIPDPVSEYDNTLNRWMKATQTMPSAPVPPEKKSIQEITVAGSPASNDKTTSSDGVKSPEHSLPGLSQKELTENKNKNDHDAVQHLANPLANPTEANKLHERDKSERLLNPRNPSEQQNETILKEISGVQTTVGIVFDNDAVHSIQKRGNIPSTMKTGRHENDFQNTGKKGLAIPQQVSPDNSLPAVPQNWNSPVEPPSTGGAGGNMDGMKPQEELMQIQQFQQGNQVRVLFIFTHKGKQLTSHSKNQSRMPPAPSLPE